MSFNKISFGLTKILTQLTKTMSEKLEFIKLEEYEIIKIYNKEKVDRITPQQYRMIFQFLHCLQKVFSLKRKLNFNDILKINEILERKIEDEKPEEIKNENGITITKKAPPGEFATHERLLPYFGDTIYIKVAPQNQNYKMEQFNNLVDILENTKDIEYKKILIFDFFVEQITEQWFSNGNKRTSFIVCNKLLLDYCCKEKNNLLMNFDRDYFILLLKSYLGKKSKYPIPKEFIGKNVKTLLINFLNRSLFYNNQEIKIKDILLSQYKSFFNFERETFSTKEVTEFLDKLEYKSENRLQDKEMEILSKHPIDIKEFEFSLLEFANGVRKESKKIKKHIKYNEVYKK